MNNLIHVSELLRLEEKLRALTEQLERVKALADRWAVSLDVEVEQMGPHLTLVTTARAGERGLRHQLTESAVLNYLGDYSTLSNIVADRITHEMLRPLVRAELLAQFERACRNIETVKRGKMS